MIPVSFFQRPYPSANVVLLHGSRPVLVDTGFGADVPELLRWLETQSVAPSALSLVVNTHFHCDHSGGNHALQAEHGVFIAAQAEQAALVNRRDPDACRADWLQQPIEPYEVNRRLHDGDLVSAGRWTWQVVATPGHTAGHISLYADVGWLNPYREGRDALDRAADSIERLARLPARIGYSGHGPAIADLPQAFDRARRRLRSWREKPERVAWHACKRIFSYNLMLTDGLEEAAIPGALLNAPWFRSHATLAFGITPDAFVPLLVAEMLRSKAARWQNGRLIAAATHQVPRAGWLQAPVSPVAWPSIAVVPCQPSESPA